MTQQDLGCNRLQNMSGSVDATRDGEKTQWDFGSYVMYLRRGGGGAAAAVQERRRRKVAAQVEIQQ
jgi:hypothetical protein